MSDSATDTATPYRPRWGRIATAAAVVVAVTAYWWGPVALRQFAFFRVKHVEVHGVHTLDASVVVQRMRVDTMQSVFGDLARVARRIEGHPQVKSVHVSRRLPGTLVVRVVENAPVALIPAEGGFRAFDSAGRVLPIDPARVPLDLPLIPKRDTGMLTLLARIRGEAPDVFSRISELRRAGANEVLVSMGLPVRALVDVTPARLAEILPVAADLTKRGLRAEELDLRYRDQVIARLP